MQVLSPVGAGLTHGSLSIFCAPRAVLSHIQWSLSEILNLDLTLHWKSQPLRQGTHRTSLSWRGAVGSGEKIVRSLRGWHYLTFELFDFSRDENHIFMYTPELGIFQSAINVHGDIQVNENQLHALLRGKRDEELRDSIETLTGKIWNDELEIFRRLDIDGENFFAGRLSV
jgi:hypothetical protein